MNVIEVKGIYGNVFSWQGDSRTDNSINSFRFRDFNVNLTNGRAT